MAPPIALVTGSNRGVGRELVASLLGRGVTKVYAAARNTDTLASIVASDPERVVAVRLDLQDEGSIAAAASIARDVRLLINNAATLTTGSAIDCDRDDLVNMLMTNSIGTVDVIRAFTPILEANGGGTIINVMSLQSFSGSNGWDGYSASKAALQSFTQSLRPALKGRGIAIVGAYPGGVDTEMIKDFDTLKSSPGAVAEGILNGLARGQEDIFPDGVSQFVADIWFSDPKEMERLFAMPERLVPMLEQAKADGRIQLS